MLTFEKTTNVRGRFSVGDMALHDDLTNSRYSVGQLIPLDVRIYKKRLTWNQEPRTKNQ